MVSEMEYQTGEMLFFLPLLLTLVFLEHVSNSLQ